MTSTQQTTAPTPLTLNRSTGSNSYCVPCALALITGHHVDLMAELIKRHLGDISIQGVFPGVAVIILKQLGYECRNLEPFDMTLSEISKRLDKSPSVRSTTYFVETQGHAQVLYDGKLWDNMNPLGVEIKQTRRNKAKVLRMWEVRK